MFFRTEILISSLHPLLPLLLEGITAVCSQLSSFQALPSPKGTARLSSEEITLKDWSMGWHKSPTSVQTSGGRSQLRSSHGNWVRLLATTFPSALEGFRCSIILFLWAPSPQISCMQICSVYFQGTPPKISILEPVTEVVLDKSELIIEAGSGVCLTDIPWLLHCGKGLERILRGNHTIYYTIQHMLGDVKDKCKISQSNDWCIEKRCEKESKQPLTSGNNHSWTPKVLQAGLTLIAWQFYSPAGHKQAHRTPASDKLTLNHNRIEQNKATA